MRRMRTVWLGVVFSVVAGAAWGAVQDAAGSNTAVPEDYPMAPQRVGEGVYAVVTPTRELPNPENKGWNSNSAFVVTGEGVLVFDTGSSEVIGTALRRAIAAVTDQPVKWVVNSHAHGDHWLGNAAFPEAEIIASPEVTARMQQDGARWVGEFKRMTAGATGEPRLVPATTRIASRTVRTLGDTKVVIFPSGGAHSPGDLLVWLPGQQVLFAGDVLYSDRMPSTFDSDLRQWVRLLESIEELQPLAVVAGHGEVTDLQGVRRLRHLLSDFWQAVEEGYEAGLAGYEMVPAVSAALAEYRADYPGLDEKVRRDISHVYLQVEAAAFAE